MITRTLLFATFLATVGVVTGAEPPIVFSGLLTSDGNTYVALTDSETKGTRWVRPGEKFNGYSVLRYDAQSDAVFLKKGNDEIRLPLVLAKTVEPATAAPTSPTPAAPNSSGIVAAVRANLRQLATAAELLRAKLGVASVSYNDLVGPGKPISQLIPVAGETYSTLNFGPDVTAISVTTSDGATISLQLQPATGQPAAPSTSGPVVASTTTPASPAQVLATGTPSASNTPAAPGQQPPPSPASKNVASQPPAADGALPATGRQPPTPSYTIQGGDTLQSIAAANGVSVQQLQELNPTLHGSSLRPGETIRIR